MNKIYIERDWEAAALKIITNITKEDIPKLNYVMNKICEFMHDMKIKEINFSSQYGLIECDAYTYDDELIGIALPIGTNEIYTTKDTVIQYFNVNCDLEIMNLNVFKKDLSIGGWFLDTDEYRRFVELWEE